MLIICVRIYMGTKTNAMNSADYHVTFIDSSKLMRKMEAEQSEVSFLRFIGLFMPFSRVYLTELFKNVYQFCNM